MTNRDVEERISLERAGGIHVIEAPATGQLSTATLRPVALGGGAKIAESSLDFASELASLVEEMRSRGAQGGNGVALMEIDAAPKGGVLTSLSSLTESASLLERARAAIRREQYDEALGIVSALRALPLKRAEKEEGHYLAALCHASNRDRKTALSELRKIPSKGAAPQVASRADALRARVRRELVPEVLDEFMATTRRDPDAARRELIAMTKLDPETGLYHYALAGSWIAAGNPKEAFDVVKRALDCKVDDRDALVALQRQIERELVADLLRPAVATFKRGDYAAARQSARRLRSRWSDIELLDDFEQYLDALVTARRTARELAPSGPFSRVDALYFLLAASELSEAKRSLAGQRLEEAETALAAALKFVPKFPYLNFLYAGCLYQLVGRRLSTSGADLTAERKRLLAARDAAKVAATDPEIGAARGLERAIDEGLRFLDELRSSVERHRQSTAAINAAVEEFQSIMEDAQAGIRDPAHATRLLDRMRALSESMPKRGDVAGAEGATVVAALEQAVKRNLKQLEAIGKTAAGQSAATDCFKTFARIMTSVGGGIGSADDVRRVHYELVDLKKAIARALDKTSDRQTKKAIKRLASTVENHLKQVATARNAVAVGDLVARFNAASERLQGGEMLTRDDVLQVAAMLDSVATEASSRRSKTKDKQVAARLAELEREATAGLKAITRATR